MKFAIDKSGFNVCLFLCLNGCAVKQDSLSVSENIAQGDGMSFGFAIVVPEKSEPAGVKWEYKWLAEKYPGYELKGQSLVFENDKPYDVIEIKTQEGRKIKIYFDISNFVGKF